MAVSEDVSNSDIRVENLMKIKNFSSLENLLLVTSYVLRFKNNSLAKIRRKTPYNKGFISTKELKYVEKLWIYSNQRKIITSSKFSQLQKSLGIFYDKKYILRVRGRFSNVDTDYDVKHPILLHNELYLTELVAWSAHKKVLHGGINNTLTFIRNDYWLCKKRKTIRAILNIWVTCKKSQSRTLLVLNRQIFRNFAWISIMNFVIREWTLLVLFMSKIYMEEVIKCLRVTYVYLLVRLRGMFISN